ncbi:hypothetical protein CYMTET_19657, partial [Cymbomonas tetramitiformis]
MKPELHTKGNTSALSALQGLHSSHSDTGQRIQFVPARRPDTLTESLAGIAPLNSLSEETKSKIKDAMGKLTRQRDSDQTTTIDPEDCQVALRWPSVRKIGAGLHNLGNTCFLNSVLQCLTYTPPLAAHALQEGHSRDTCRVGGFCAACAMQLHIKTALTSSGRAFAPKSFCQNLRQISRCFRIGRQEDSHEFMRYLLESMHKSSLRALKTKPTSGEPSTFVYKAFGGRLLSQVSCMNCKYNSNTYDTFLDLSVDIHKASTLQK